MKKILLFVGLVAITMVSCTSAPKEEAVVATDSTIVVGNVDTTAVVKLDSCAVDTCKK
jgi:PBP1b-binding outer membrane lipoprotein LpoB